MDCASFSYSYSYVVDVLLLQAMILLQETLSLIFIFELRLYYVCSFRIHVLNCISVAMLIGERLEPSLLLSTDSMAPDITRLLHFAQYPQKVCWSGLQWILNWSNPFELVCAALPFS